MEFINVDQVDHQFEYKTDGVKKTIYLWGQGADLPAGKEADASSLFLYSGEYHFVCIPHPWMHSVTVHVEVDDDKCRALWE